MDALFYPASKLLGPLLRPDMLLVLMLAAALLMSWRRPRASRALLAAALAALLLLGVLPLGHLLARTLEDRYPPDPPLAEVHGIVILGGAEEPGPARRSGQPEFNAAAERLTAAAALARAHPQARLVFTSGAGRFGPGGELPRGVAISRDLLIALGVAPDRITLEPRARNTAENAALALPLADPRPAETWVLVTSAWHMPRAMDSFARAGWPALVPWPVDHRALPGGLRPRWNLAENLDVLNIMTREWVGRAAYRLTGR